MTKNILIDLPIEPTAMERLRSIPGVQVKTIDHIEDFRHVPVEVISDVHIEFCAFPPQNFDDMRQIEFIQICSAGYSQLFNLSLPERGVRASNGRGIFDIPIAEWNIAMLVNLARDLRGMIRNQDAGIWDRSAQFQVEIRGKTVGLWGYGGIGRETARMARALGLRVHVLSQTGVHPRENIYVVEGTGDPKGVLPDRVFVAGQEHEFLSDLDFLILAMPLTKKTEGLIGETELRSLRPSAFVLNPARGPIIQEGALLRALREGWIAGAALDTHYRYPMLPDHPLWRFPNVIMTPHISGSALSPWFLVRAWDVFLQNVERFFSGAPLLNELTASQLHGN
jgi:phosphoglycerate dehydrogenase-like enzyme